MELMSVSPKAKEWLDYLLVLGRSPKTLRVYSEAIHYFEAWAGKPIDECNEGDVVRYLAYCKKRGIKADTIRLWFFAVTRCMRYFGIEVNIPTPKPKAFEPTWYTEEEVRKVFEALPHDMARAYFELARSSGLRRKEILGLRWKDLDLTTRKGVVRVKGGRYQVFRYSPLASKLLGLIRPHLAKEEDYIFSVHGKRLCYSTPYRWITDALKRAGIKKRRRIHAFRGSFAVTLLKHKVPTRVVQRLGRWKTLGMVERYSDFLEEELDEIYEEVFNKEEL